MVDLLLPQERNSLKPNEEKVLIFGFEEIGYSMVGVNSFQTIFVLIVIYKAQFLREERGYQIDLLRRIVIHHFKVLNFLLRNHIDQLVDVGGMLIDVADRGGVVKGEVNELLKPAVGLRVEKSAVATHDFLLFVVQASDEVGSCEARLLPNALGLLQDYAGEDHHRQEMVFILFSGC
jgi:hypothetical protein